MTRTLGRRSGAVAVLLTAIVVAIPGSPAAAAEGGPIITIDAPRAAPPLDTGSVTVSGSASVGGAIYSMKDVTLTAGGDTKRVECAESPCRFSWTLARPKNGPYQVKVTATQAAVLLGTAGPSNEATRSFSVAAPPAKPTLDPPKVTDGRGVELSWTRNSEPDMLYYAVFRKDPGASHPRRVGGNIAQPATGTRVTFTDTTTSLLNGGDYAYQVVAVRNGASGTADTEVTSDPSGSAGATVPAAPPSTAPPAAAGPSTTLRPGPPAGADLSGFLSSRSQPGALPPITVPEAPDTGFGSLPFGAGLADEELEEGEADAVPPRDRSSVFSRVGNGRPLVPVAGGLVLLLLALHMRLLSARVKAPVDRDLPVEGDMSASEPEPLERVKLLAEPSPVVETERETELEPATRFYDIAQEADWAPVAVERELEPVELEPELVALVPEPQAEPDPVPSLPQPALLLDDMRLDEQFRMDEQFPMDEQFRMDDVDLEEEIEVFEVVSPTRRPLARAGSR